MLWALCVLNCLVVACVASSANFEETEDSDLKGNEVCTREMERATPRATKMVPEPVFHALQLASQSPDFPSSYPSHTWKHLCTFDSDTDSLVGVMNNTIVNDEEDAQLDQLKQEFVGFVAISGAFWLQLLEFLLAHGGPLPLVASDTYQSLALKLCNDPSSTNLELSDLLPLFQDLTRSGQYTDAGFNLEESHLRQLLVLAYLYLAPSGEHSCDRPLTLYVQGMGIIACYFAWKWPLPIAGPACRRFINVLMKDLYGNRYEMDAAARAYQEPSFVFLEEWTKLQGYAEDAPETILLSVYREIMFPLLGTTWLDCMLTTLLNFESTEKLLAFFFLNRFSLNESGAYTRQVINNILHHYVFVRTIEQVRQMDFNSEHVVDEIEEAINVMSTAGFTAPSLTKPGAICFNDNLFYQSMLEVIKIMCPESISVANFVPFVFEPQRARYLWQVVNRLLDACSHIAMLHIQKAIE
mgnify:CR=1 FL=1